MNNDKKYTELSLMGLYRDYQILHVLKPVTFKTLWLLPPVMFVKRLNTDQVTLVSKCSQFISGGGQVTRFLYLIIYIQ